MFLKMIQKPQIENDLSSVGKEYMLDLPFTQIQVTTRIMTGTSLVGKNPLAVQGGHPYDRYKWSYVEPL